MITAVFLTSLNANGKRNGDGAIAVGNEKTQYNFLLMGVDMSERLADVMMLVSLDTKNNTLAVAQIPRDTYAEYTTAAYRKINGCVSSLGNGRAAADFLEKTLCITIDHYITVDLDGVAKTVDMLGGVEVNIPENMSYEDIYQDLKIELKAGKILLDGESAKQFIRYRSGYVRGDIARLDAQKLFLAALGQKMMSRGTVDLVRPVVTLISESESDLTVSDCMFFVSSVMSIDSSRIFFLTLPGSDVRTDNGTWYYIINKRQTYNAMKSYFFSDAEYANFDKDRAFTGTYSKEFNSIYDAESGYEAEIYTADKVNREGIEIERTDN